jgi:hypothetical protein
MRFVEASAELPQAELDADWQRLQQGRKSLCVEPLRGELTHVSSDLPAHLSRARVGMAGRRCIKKLLVHRTLSSLYYRLSSLETVEAAADGHLDIPLGPRPSFLVAPGLSFNQKESEIGFLAVYEASKCRLSYKSGLRLI